jgi:hypothetical protein
MGLNCRFLLLITLSVFGAAVARAREPVQDAVPNWPAPATWSPHSVSRGVSAMGAVTSPIPFIGLAPCRIVDTRGNGAPIQGGMFTGGSDVRNYAVAGICGIPGSAQALSLNFTVVGPTGSGFLVAWPTGGAVPPVSILNFNAGDIRNNAAVVPTNSSVSFTVNVSAATHVIIDVNGYYAPAGVGDHNTFLGLNAGNFTMPGDNNTGLGHNALLSNTTGFNNTATGHNALTTNDIGSHNTATGSGALANDTSGTHNTATGSGALLLNILGSGNTASGAGALGNTTGENNIGVGNFAGSNLTTGSNNICIGNSGLAGESNAIRIGTEGTQTATFIAGISGAISSGGLPVFVNASGQLGTISPTSSRRFKQGIRNVGDESDGLMRLRPVTFKYKAELDPTGLTQYGLIAEEVAEVYPDLVDYDRDGQPESVRYHLVNALLLNEVQKQHRTVEAQMRRIEQQNEAIEQLKSRLARLEARILTDSRP